MNNYFIKKLAPQFVVWMFTTFLLNIIAEPYSPQIASSVVSTLQRYPDLCSFVVFLISFLLYVLYVTLRFASKFYQIFYNDIENISHSLHDCYFKFVIDDRERISKKIKSLDSTTGCDLLWETHGLALENICRKEVCSLSWPFKNYFEIISERRRKRMIRISLSYLNWRTTSCLAVETHLKNVICNTTKFEADCRYREDQIKKLKKTLNLSKLGITKLEIKRIVIIKENDWKYLKEKHLYNLLQYFQWHVTNCWEVLLCINNDNDSPLTLSSICQHGDNTCNDFSDFVIVKKRLNNNLIVFAQNSIEKAYIVNEKANDNGIYFTWFNNVWKKGDASLTDGYNEFYHIDEKFIDQLYKNK